MALGLLLPLRILQLALAISILGLSVYVAQWYNVTTSTASPSQINFLVFVPVWTFVAILYLELTPRFAKRASHPYSHFALEVITALFYFAGFIALSVFLAKLLFCRGAVCASARAAAALSAFSFIAWLATTTLLGAQIFKGGFRAAQANVALNSAMAQTKV